MLPRDRPCRAKTLSLIRYSPAVTRRMIVTSSPGPTSLRMNAAAPAFDRIEQGILVLARCEHDDPDRGQLALDSLGRLDPAGGWQDRSIRTMSGEVSTTASKALRPSSASPTTSGSPSSPGCSGCRGGRAGGRRRSGFSSSRGVPADRALRGADPIHHVPSPHLQPKAASERFLSVASARLNQSVPAIRELDCSTASLGDHSHAADGAPTSGGGGHVTWQRHRLSGEGGRLA